MNKHLTAAAPGVAWQRLIRDRLRDEDGAGDLFGRWWEGVDTDIAKAVVRETDHATAKEIILRHEWLGTMPAMVLGCYGIFFDGHCGGAVVYAVEPIENLGKFDRYGFTGRMIRLARGACVHWAHEHAASKLIRRSMDLLPAKYEVVTATIDRRAGEIGTIYQACGFSYVGVMSSDHSMQKWAVVDGQRVSERELRRRHGHSRGSFGGGGFAEPRKERYFAFRGSRAARRRHAAAIAHMVQPYPKRARPAGE